MADEPKGYLVSPEVFGRRLRAARILQGYSTGKELAEAINRLSSGYSVSERTVYAIERGDQAPSIDFYFAAMIVLRPPGGGDYFLEALTGDMRQRFVDSLKP